MATTFWTIWWSSVVLQSAFEDMFWTSWWCGIVLFRNIFRPNSFDHFLWEPLGLQLWRSLASARIGKMLTPRWCPVAFVGWYTPLTIEIHMGADRRCKSNNKISKPVGTFFIFPFIGNNHPSWLIFQRGWNHQPDYKRACFFSIRDCITLRRDWLAIGSRLRQHLLFRNRLL